ncbi:MULTISPECIES: J domain-containing protein [unclassified Ruegeria]|uniref:J domain-containing protein n=1 Tax=unclassified Ruegeria TaxID=2625375 RepID=UPI0014921E1E|nr:MULTISPECIES: J domain-containing protein [unclassified Ruegeria]NOD35320.1 DnaJ domain-containing protein [Ruegeria sp. HKCCD7296]NOE42916.1 DnaJ domain-containing protein [Ruegeria sp. HKCCD7319]
MEPVDKVRARTDALADLGLPPSASSREIREAWRQIAFHSHPDHREGDSSGFSRAKAAYDFLRKEGLAKKGGGKAGPTQPRRPHLKKRIIELPQEEISACKAMLSPDQVLSHRHGEDDTPGIPEACVSDHVPDAVGCYGRHLTYFVTTPVHHGANRVALPTTVLSGARHTEAEILSFQSKDTGAGEVVIPDTIRERKFPGAKSVKIRFDADQDIRDQFWLAG